METGKEMQLKEKKWKGWLREAQTLASLVSGYYYPCFHYIGGSGSVGGSKWLYAGDQDPLQFYSNPNVTLPNYSKNFLSDDHR